MSEPVSGSRKEVSQALATGPNSEILQSGDFEHRLAHGNPVRESRHFAPGFKFTRTSIQSKGKRPMNVLLALIAVLYLVIGQAAYRKIIAPTQLREALKGDENAMLNVIHDHERSITFYAGYAGWLVFYPVFIALGWVISRFVPE